MPSADFCPITPDVAARRADWIPVEAGGCPMAFAVALSPAPIVIKATLGVGAQSMPDASQLPPSLGQFAKHNAAGLYFGPEFDSRCEILISDIQAALPNEMLPNKVSAWLASVLRIYRG